MSDNQLTGQFFKAFAAVSVSSHAPVIVLDVVC